MRTYKTPHAFKQALKARVKKRARKAGRGFNRTLQLVLFERFLARAYEALGEAVILKGGFALELRLTRARTTKDIDLRVEGDVDDLLEALREKAGIQGDDFLTFELAGETDFEEMIGDQVVYDGRRLKVQALLAGQPFGGVFRLDVSVADRLVLPPERVSGTDLFEFAGIESLEHRVYPKEAHVAEKLHALTLDYNNGPNSRAKDLVDIGLLADHHPFTAHRLRESIESTFEFRDTHDIPGSVPEPPEFWRGLYDQMQKEDELRWDNIDALHAFCTEFLHPLLKGTANGDNDWSSTQKQWL